MGKLTFMNADAKPRNVTVTVSDDSVAHIMAWYGSHHVGDRYTVAYDGRNVAMDHNGLPLEPSKIGGSNG